MLVDQGAHKAPFSFCVVLVRVSRNLVEIFGGVK